MDFCEESEGHSASRSPGRPDAESREKELRELAVRFSRRDREAFAEVFRLFRDSIHVIGVLELGDPEEAQDLVQETFRRAWSSASALMDPGRLRPWLFSIARNLSVDLAKRARRRPTTVRDFPDWRLTQSSAETPLPAAIRREAAQRVRDLLHRVPENFRMVLALRLLEGKSYEDIATALDLPLHGVKNAIARGGRLLFEKIRNSPELSWEGEQ
jgi:RNA polymerase sigma-70 factor (ECF subfamily)